MQIGNYTADKSWWGRLDTYNLDRPVYYNTTYNGMADVASQISAALTASALVIRDTNPTQYNKLMGDAVVSTHTHPPPPPPPPGYPSLASSPSSSLFQLM